MEIKNITTDAKDELSEASNKKVGKIITGSATVKKPSAWKAIKSNLISGDFADIKQYIVHDILLPSIKDAISDIVSKGVDMALYGETRNRSRSTGTGVHTPYGSYFRQGTGTYQPSQQKKQSPAMDTKQRYQYDDIVLDSRGDAEDVLESLKGLAAEYGVVSIADYFDLLGLPTQYTDNNWGWYDLSGAQVIRSHGAFAINLPRAVSLK